ncbi:MAG: hypothetical protein ACRD0N_03960 [Acidimicrobiales bacterium]
MPGEHGNDQKDSGRKAPEGQGSGWAPDGTPETSIFDGAGNESVVVLAENEKDGRVAEGAGATREEALENARKQDSLLSDEFSPGKH